MTRIAVTGAGGFIGRHLIGVAGELGIAVVPIVHSPAGLAGELIADLRREDAIDSLFTTAAGPDAIIHLAGAAHRGAAAAQADLDEWAMARNLIGAAARREPAPSIVFAGSCAEYGDQGPGPIPESATLKPQSAYGRLKAELGKRTRDAAAQAEVPAVWTRCFNLIGPGQPASAPIANWARQLSGPSGEPVEISVGSLEVIRDLLDVRDAARYLIELAIRAAGEASVPPIVNVCSGQGVALSTALDRMIELAGVQAEVTQDPALGQSTALASVVGDATRLRSIVEPLELRALRTTLDDVLAEWRAVATTGRQA